MSTPHRPTGLTDRDFAVVRMVHEFHGCTTRQIHVRFWGEQHAPAASYRRVAKLIEAGYLSSRRLPSRSGVGSGKRFLTLGLTGRELMAESLRFPVRDLRASDSVTPFFVEHHEAVGDFRIAMELAMCASHDVSLRSWTNERELRATPIRVEDKFPARGADITRVITLVPDAEFTLVAHGKRQEFLVEVDMGTITLSRLQLRVRGYLRLQLERSSPVLFVVPSSSRVARIATMVEKEAKAVEGYSELVFITTRDVVSKGTVLHTPIWTRPGLPDKHPLMGRRFTSELGGAQRAS